MTVTAPRRIPTTINTKIVGTTFEGRQAKLARCQELGIQTLYLRRDYANPYDPEAVAVEAHLVDSAGNISEVVQLGYLSNSDRMCLVCGKMMDGLAFSKTKTVKCPECNKLSLSDGSGSSTCPECSTVFKTENAKTIVCPTCYSTDWVRDGLASVVSRVISSGVNYRVRVLDYTGGTVDDKGKTKSRGCNIRLEQLEDDKEI